MFLASEQVEGEKPIWVKKIRMLSKEKKSKIQSG